MLRKVLTAASILALASGAAWAQDQTTSDPAATTDSSAQTQVGTPEYTDPMTTEGQEMAPSTHAAAPDPLQVASVDDLNRFSEAEFALADANADARLDQTEYVAYASAHLAASDEGIVGEGDAEIVGNWTPEESFAKFSKGKADISKDEFAKARKKVFDKADLNNDDLLDSTEQAEFAALLQGRKDS